MRRAHLVLLAALIAGCQTITDMEHDSEDPDGLCPALQAFAEGIPAGQAQRAPFLTIALTSQAKVK